VSLRSLGFNPADIRLSAAGIGAAALALDPDMLLSEVEAASLLGISHRTLQTWRLETTAGPPVVKLGGKLVKYRRRDLLAWMDANTVRKGKRP